jgi:hypothetical protein
MGLRPRSSRPRRTGRARSQQSTTPPSRPWEPTPEPTTQHVDECLAFVGGPGEPADRRTDHDNDFSKIRRRAWWHLKLGLGQELGIAELMERLEEIAGGHDVRRLLSVALHHFSELKREDQARAVARWFLWREAVELEPAERGGGR